MLMMLRELYSDITVESHWLSFQNTSLTPHGDGLLKSRSLSEVPVSCKRIVQRCRCAPSPGVGEREREKRENWREESASTLETRQHYTDSTTRQTNSEPRLIFCFTLCNMIKWPMFSFYKLNSYKCFQFYCKKKNKVQCMYKVKKNTIVLKVNLAYR